MPGHLTPTAKAIADALKAGAELKGLADTLFAELGPITEPYYIGTDGNDVLVALPGYGPLADPSDHLLVAKLAT